MWCYVPCANDPNRILFVNMLHNEKPSLRGESCSKESLLANGMIWVRTGGRQRVSKNGLRLFKRHLMVYQILGGLCWIPDKSHRRSVACANFIAKVSSKPRLSGSSELLKT